MQTCWEYEQYAKPRTARDGATIVMPFINIGIPLLAMLWCDLCCCSCFVSAINGASAVVAGARVLMLIVLCCVTSLMFVAVTAASVGGIKLVPVAAVCGHSVCLVAVVLCLSMINGWCCHCG